MSEWWTYRPGDFLMFAPRTYWRLFELHNQASGPAFWLVALAALAAFGLLWRRLPPWRLLALGLALAWAGVGGLFLMQRYAAVFWAMEGAAWLFLAQAAVLLVLAAGRWQAEASPTGAVGGRLIFAWAVLGQPLLAGLSGRPWMQAEVLGLAPDPTVFATLGLLLCAAPAAGVARVLWTLSWGLCLAWCAFSAATLWTMGSAQGAVPAVVAGVAVVAALALRRGRRLRPGRASAPPARPRAPG